MSELKLSEQIWALRNKVHESYLLGLVVQAEQKDEEINRLNARIEELEEGIKNMLLNGKIPSKTHIYFLKPSEVKSWTGVDINEALSELNKGN